ncbi:MAG: Holliday junction resolvase RuvX [Phycisphaerae bacterium]|nr:Holliday junction resolvase RuvX [Phycisphaerae bacterium]
MRFLSIDLGQKRTGIATGDDIVGLVQPREVLMIPQGDALIAALVRVIDDVGPDVVIIGLPTNMDGTEGPAAAGVRAFGERVAARTKVRIEYQDERLTSFAAEESLKRSGRTRGEKKEIRDALAAAEILRDYLRRIRGESEPPDGPMDDPSDDLTHD